MASQEARIDRTYAPTPSRYIFACSLKSARGVLKVERGQQCVLLRFIAGNRVQQGMRYVVEIYLRFAVGKTERLEPRHRSSLVFTGSCSRARRNFPPPSESFSRSINLPVN